MGARLEITVSGKPAPQGSKQARPIYKGRGAGRTFTGRVAQVESSKAVGPWRDAVRAETQQALRLKLAAEGPDAWPWGVPDVPMVVTVTFYADRPQTHYGTGRNAGKVKDSAPVYPAGQPDVDKLARSTLDGLTAGHAFRDDSQVVSLFAHKRYADSQPAGCVITVEVL